MTRFSQPRYSQIPLAALLACVTGVSLGAAYAPCRAQDAITPTNIAPLPTASDLFAGADKPGPYTLKWKKLPPYALFKPSVIVDGKTLNESEYQWDGDKGTITFAAPLKAASMAHVVYPYDPKGSEHNDTPASSPVTVPLVNAGGTQLQLSALPGAAKGHESDTLLIWRLSGAPMNALGGKVTTSALLAPDTRADAPNGSALWERAGFAAGYRMGSDTSGLEANFSRSGRDFAPTLGKTFAMSDTASQTLSLAARYALAPWLRAEWKQTGTDLLAKDAGTTGLETMLLRLGGAGNQPTLNLSRTADGRTDGKGVTNRKSTDRMELTAKMGSQVALTGNAQTTKSDVDGKVGDKTTEMAIAIKAQSTDKTQAASVAVSGLEKEAGATNQANSSVTVTLQPSPSVTIVAEQKKEASTTTAATGDTHTEKDLASAGAKIALAPGASLSGGVSVQSSADTKTQTGVQATTLSAKFGEGKGVEVAQALVNRSGNMPGTATLNTTDTRFALRPVRGLTLSGALVNNPEKDGNITQAQRQEMGLSAQVGALKLGGGYTLTETAAQNGLQKGEFSLSLGLRFDRYTQMSGEYRDGLLWGTTESTQGVAHGLRVYTLGLTRDMGAAFNFALGGTMSQDRTPGATPSDYKAEAKLGAKF